jgi:hypothetical protein
MYSSSTSVLDGVGFPRQLGPKEIFETADRDDEESLHLVGWGEVDVAPWTGVLGLDVGHASVGVEGLQVDEDVGEMTGGGAECGVK